MKEEMRTKMRDFGKGGSGDDNGEGFEYSVEPSNKNNNNMNNNRMMDCYESLGSKCLDFIQM
jgi:hypothetical protein